MAFNSLQRENTISTTYPGLYVGRVEAVEDEADMGRIKVSIPSIFGRTAPEFQIWARPCFPYGHFFVPNEGDKVWIIFENGNPRNPVWLGIFYPQTSEAGGDETTVPEVAQVSPPVKRVIRSASGHLIIFDDTEEGNKLILQDQVGNRIELGETGVLLKCERDLTIDATGKNIVIKANSVDVQKAV